MPNNSIIKPRKDNVRFNNTDSIPINTSRVSFQRSTLGEISAYTTAGGGPGSGVTFGTRANLPGQSPPIASGTLYLCTDSPYSYLSDGSNWNAYIHSWPVTEPSSLTKINSGPTTTLVQTYGGYYFYASGAGDQVVSYVKAVTPSSTLRVALGFHLTYGTQGGAVLYNANNNKVYFFRAINNLEYVSEVWRSMYTSDGTTLSTPNSLIGTARIWPRSTFIFRFDGTSFYFDYNPDPSGNLVSKNLYSETLATNIGTNYTHIGFGINMQSSGEATWGQHLKVIST